jgi:hypothetical protein
MTLPSFVRALVVGVLACTLASCATRGAMAPAASYGGAAPRSAPAPNPQAVSAQPSVVPTGAPNGGVRDGLPTSTLQFDMPNSTRPLPDPATPTLTVDEARETRIGDLAAVVEQQRGALASLSECRDICAAASQVCTAAEEICALTGDGSGNARDARCTRARGHCVDALQRRDGRCPVCPAR